MAKNTWHYGHMKKERLVWELDKKNYMNGNMTLIPSGPPKKQELIEHQCTPK